MQECYSKLSCQISFIKAKEINRFPTGKKLFSLDQNFLDTGTQIILM